MSDLWEYGGNTDDSDTSSNSSDGSMEGAPALESYIAPEKLKKIQTMYMASEMGPSGSMRGATNTRKRDFAEVTGSEEEEEEEEEERGWTARLSGRDDELGSMPSFACVVDEEATKAQHVLQNCLRGGGSNDDDDDDDEYSDVEDEDAILYTSQQHGKGNEDASIRSIQLRLIDADRHEFSVNAVVESTFEYPFAKFEEHARQQGWIQDTQHVKYVLEGDPIDPQMNTPHDFDLEDGDTIEVYYYSS